MKNHLIIYFLLPIAFHSCKNEASFDNQKLIDKQIKKCIDNYLIDVVGPDEDFALYLHKYTATDSVILVVNAVQSIALMDEDTLLYHSRYKDIIVFTNYWSRGLDGPCNTIEAAAMFDKFGYEDLKSNSMPVLRSIWDIQQLKLIIHDNKVVSHKYIW
jgi:hypothetical protein